jgi:hypothetical protein
VEKAEIQVWIEDRVLFVRDWHGTLFSRPLEAKEQPDIALSEAMQSLLEIGETKAVRFSHCQPAPPHPELP